jgi:two-component system, NarL family, invasion response regulator UvrY
MKRVLITDDHPIVRQSIKQLLESDSEKRFVTIDEACNGKEMIDKLHHNEFDLILLDVSMPGGSGLDFLPEIKKSSPSTPVLMISSYAEEQYALRALKLGASGYLVKSTLAEDLPEALTRVLRGELFFSAEVSGKLSPKESVEKRKQLLRRFERKPVK